MNGIEPPSPMYIASLPKYAVDALLVAASSHGASSGAFQPALSPSSSNVTLAPYGGSFSNSSFNFFVAFAASAVGGTRTLIFTVVFGRSTFPASFGSGIPLAPVIDNVGRHVRFNSSSVLSFATGCVLPAHGNSFQISSLSAFAVAFDC